MAKDKKSFVLYADLIHTVKKMPEDKAGKLLLTILEYVNDENPKVDDMVVDLVFEPIKQQLKRDLIKFEQKKVQWSEAGKRSAEVRKAKKDERTLTNVKSRSTDSTVNVNVSVNDIDNEIKQSLFSLWLNYRKDIKKPIKSESTLTTLIKRFNKEELSVIDKVVNNSIENGWTGLFWDKAVKEKKKSSKSATSNLSF